MHTSGSTHNPRQTQLDAVLAEYLERADAGEAVDRARFLAEHADLADELRAYWEASDELGGWAGARTSSQGPTPAYPADATTPLGAVGHSVGDYELLEVLGRGGMGVIWKARQKRVHRLVALKMMLAGRFASPAEVQRFRAEAEAIANLDHPNILPVYEVGEHEGQPYFTMRLIDGGSLAQWIADRRSHAADLQKPAARLLAQVARAVHHAHQRGILHRDLKPANILLQRSEVRSQKSEVRSQKSEVTTQGLNGGRPTVVPSDLCPLTSDLWPADLWPLVTDFGLARRVDGGGLTSTGDVLGTPSYLAPELAASEKGSATTAADVYGLGAILYEVLTGRPPFQAATPVATLLQVRDREPERPRQLNPAVSRDLETVCLKCLDKEPARRYASAAALADDLERWLRGEPVHARRTGLAERTLKWARRRPALAALLGVIFLAALGLIGGGLWFTVKLQDEKARALEAFRETCQAIDTFYDSARLNWWLAGEPGSEDARRELSQAALEHYRRIVDRQASDPAAQLEVGLAYARIAGLTSQLESPAAGLPLIRQAVAILERQVREQPGDPRSWRSLASVHLVLGHLCAATGEKSEARSAVTKSVELFSQLVRDYPQEADYACELADSLQELAFLDLTEGRQSAAEESQRRAVEINSKVADEHANVARYALHWVLRQENLGQIIEKGAGLTEAVDWYTRAGDNLRTLLAARPHYKEARQALARVYNHRARALVKMDRHADAAEDLRRVIELGTEPFADAWRQPVQPRVLRAIALARAGQCAQAVTEADLLAGEKLQGPHFIELARVYALAAQAETRAPSSRTAETGNRSERYAARAVELLTKAHATSGLTGPAQITATLRAPEFAALASRADFAELRRRWEERLPGPTP